MGGEVGHMRGVGGRKGGGGVSAERGELLHSGWRSGISVN